MGYVKANTLAPVFLRHSDVGKVPGAGAAGMGRRSFHETRSASFRPRREGRRGSSRIATCTCHGASPGGAVTAATATAHLRASWC